MSLPVSVPYAFANATTTQNLSYLDFNFNAIANGLNGLSNGSSQISVSSISATGTANNTTYLRGDGAWANISTGSTSSISNGTSNVSVDSANGPVSINTNGSNAMYIDASQNVGIGTTTPAATLDVRAASGIIRTTATTGTNTTNIGFTNTGGSFYVGLDSSTGGNFGAGSYGATLYNGANSPMVFFTNAAERMRIDSSGNLLVGATSGSGERLRVNFSGNQGICVNTTSTNATLAIQFVYNSTTEVGKISTTTTSTAYNTSSDYRLKENVQPMTTGLATIGALKPVTYNWISDKSVGEGFIAHELQAVIPLAVTGEKDEVDVKGGIKAQGVDYSKIVVHLVAAIQELTAEVTALKAKVGQ